MTTANLLVSLALAFSSFVLRAQEAHPEMQKEVLEALAGATNVVLYSLVPERALGQTNSVMGYPILGSAQLDDQSAKMAIDAVSPTVKAWSQQPNLCIFEPRHALRIAAQGKVYLILLCYHCHDIWIIRLDAGEAYFHLLGSADVFDHLLARNKIQLSP